MGGLQLVSGLRKQGMFTIEVHLSDIDLSGLEALDWRRSHGLPDGTKLHTQPWTTRPYLQTVQVDEQFAREHFPPDRTVQWVWPDVQTTDYLMINPRDANHLVPCIPEDVVKEMYIRQRTKFLAWQALPWWKALFFILIGRSPT